MAVWRARFSYLRTRESDLMMAAMDEKTPPGILGTVEGDRDISKAKIGTVSSTLLSFTQWLCKEMPVSCSPPRDSRNHVQAYRGD